MCGMLTQYTGPTDILRPSTGDFDGHFLTVRGCILVGGGSGLVPGLNVKTVGHGLQR